MTSIGRLLPWDDFRANYVDPCVPGRVTVSVEPRVELSVDAEAGTLLLDFHDVDGAAPGRFKGITFTPREDRRLTVSVGRRSLFRPAYAFFEDVVDRVSDGAAPGAALTEAVDRWKDIFGRDGGLSPEARVGLWGELLFLDALVAQAGPDALKAWVGPHAEAHDFRLPGREFEVKTTRGRRRAHTFSGVGQASPSPGRSLHVVSIMVRRSGSDGLTLAGICQKISSGLPSIAASRFLATLEDAFGVDPETDGDRYPEAWETAAPVMAVEVADGFPRITQQSLEAAGTRHRPDLIGSVSYVADLTGLGRPLDLNGDDELLSGITENLS